MSILVHGGLRVIVAGITGRAARRHTANMLEYGTRIVAGVRPGAGGEEVHGVPVFDDFRGALAAHPADAAVLFVPARAMKAVAFEALQAGIGLLVMVSEHVPLHDTMAIRALAERRGAHVIGPNTPGIIAPGIRCKLGFMPQIYSRPGRIGVASRSGTLTYEITSRLTAAGLGQSTCVGVGGDALVGSSFAKLLRLFEADAETDAVVLVGEIGGVMEEEAAALVAAGEVTKPVVAYIAGRTAPPAKRLGHAGAIIAGDRGTMASKLEAFARAGVPVAAVPAEVPELVARALAARS
jgi:succinyl-CoA synthetase alpha subunit